MLTSIQFRELDNSLLLSLPIGAPSSSGFFIKEVDGLGAVKADVTLSQFSGYDGGLYQNSRVSSRNIVITVGMAPRFGTGRDVSTLRDEIYNIAPPKSSVNLVFISDDFEGGNEATRKIQGVVESVEPSIFTKDPELQISILCPSPYFKSYIPFEIEGRSNTPLNTSKFGSAPAGFVLDITYQNTHSKLTLETEFDEPLVLEGSINAGDRVRISTVAGNKFVVLTKAGTSNAVSILDYIVSGPMNLSLDKRTKSFYVNKGFGGANPYTVFYTPEYVGL